MKKEKLTDEKQKEEMDGDEREAIALYKEYQKKHLPATETLGGLWAPDFDHTAYPQLDRVSALRKYLDELEPYARVLNRAAHLRQLHYEQFMTGKEDDGHRKWREGMNAIANDALEKYKYWEKIHDSEMGVVILQHESRDRVLSRDSILSIQDLSVRNVDYDQTARNEISVVFRPKLSEREKQRRKKTSKEYARKKKAQEQLLVKEASEKYCKQYDIIDKLTTAGDMKNPNVKSYDSKFLLEKFTSEGFAKPDSCNYLAYSYNYIGDNFEHWSHWSPNGIRNDNDKYNEEQEDIIRGQYVITGRPEDIVELATIVMQCKLTFLEHCYYKSIYSEKEYEKYLEERNTTDSEVRIKKINLHSIWGNYVQTQRFVMSCLPPLMLMLSTSHELKMMLTDCKLPSLCYDAVATLISDIVWSMGCKSLVIYLERFKERWITNIKALNAKKSTIGDMEPEGRIPYAEITDAIKFILEIYPNSFYITMRKFLDEAIRYDLMVKYPVEYRTPLNDTTILQTENDKKEMKLALEDFSPVGRSIEHNLAFANMALYKVRDPRVMLCPHSDYSSLIPILGYKPAPSPALREAWKKSYDRFLTNIKLADQ